MISWPRVGKRPVVFVTVSLVCSGILFYLVSRYQLARLDDLVVVVEECDLPVWADQWISHAVYTGETFPDPAIDVVYSWVNGSDPVYRDIRTYYQTKSPVYATDDVIRLSGNRAREHDELRYSIRSVMKNVPDIRLVHIISSDLIHPGTLAYYGLRPTWLAVGALQPRLHYTSTFYEPVDALPVFNSRALETQLINIPDLTDNFIYLNDDMFITSPQGLYKWWTPLGGVNLHLESSIQVMSYDIDPNTTTHVTDADWSTEWGALFYTNSILSQRFGHRERTYLAHFSRSLSRYALAEAQMTFSRATVDTARMRFRGEGLETNTGFLHHHYIIERNREILLHAILTRADTDRNGHLDTTEIDALLSHITTSSTIRRNTCAMLSNMTNGTAVEWSWLHGGHPNAYKLETVAQISEWDAPKYNPTDDPLHTRTCNATVLRDVCFHGVPVDQHQLHDIGDWVTRFGSILVPCGDCLLTLASTSSSSDGLADYLPLDSARRDPILSALLRFPYVMSPIQGEFIMATSASVAFDALTTVMQAEDEIDELCINDDVDSSPAHEAAFDAFLRDFFRVCFSEPHPAERDFDNSIVSDLGRRFWALYNITA